VRDDHYNNESDVQLFDDIVDVIEPHFDDHVLKPNFDDHVDEPDNHDDVDLPDDNHDNGCGLDNVHDVDFGHNDVDDGSYVQPLDHDDHVWVVHVHVAVHNDHDDRCGLSHDDDPCAI
jgi:hypothetical protein